MLDTLIALTDVMAIPLTIGIVVFLFLFCVVRPYFNLLAEKKKLEALAAIEKARKMRQEKIDNKISSRGIKAKNSAEMTMSEKENSPDSSAMATREKISKLAESNPERAGDLVKEWLKNDD
jgi:flagellar biosynthesis/type III secretory pathway M-ring protein FliF/YscJ